MNNNELSKNKNVVKSDLQGGLDIPVKLISWRKKPIKYCFIENL
jgi:hypothetical protein